MSERGKYIVGEGGDGTGKSTQIILMDKFARSLGYDTLRVFNEETGQEEPIQEPGGTPLANELRKKIKDKSIERTPWENVEWFTEARLSLNEELIQPSLEKGMYVFSARNWFSSVAYQGYGQGIPVDEIIDYTRDRLGEDYINPDSAVIFAIEEEEIRQKRIVNRIGADAVKDTFESMPDTFQTSMQFGYVDFAKKQGIHIVDAGKPKVTVFRSFLEHIEPLLDN